MIFLRILKLREDLCNPKFLYRKGTIYHAFIRGFFGMDAVRFGVGFGGFSFLWKIINNGLRYIRNKDDHWNGLIAGILS
jgi:hypothetical protein